MRTVYYIKYENESLSICARVCTCIYKSEIIRLDVIVKLKKNKKLLWKVTYVFLLKSID